MADHRPNRWLSLIAWLMPTCRFKLWALRFLGNRIGDGVVIGPTLVLGCGRFSIADGAVITDFNVFRRLSGVELGPRSLIGSFNQFTAAVEFQQHSPLVGKLIVGEQTIITNRHYFDCSGQVILGPYSVVGGLRSIIQSHEADLADNITKCGRVVLDRNAMTGTGCILLKDSHLPERSVLAAGSVLPKSRAGDNMPISSLYGGTPARFIKELKDFQWWDRPEVLTPAAPFDDTVFRTE